MLKPMVVGTKALGTSLGEAATGVDLGGSSKKMQIISGNNIYTWKPTKTLALPSMQNQVTTSTWKKTIGFNIYANITTI